MRDHIERGVHRAAIRTGLPRAAALLLALASTRADAHAWNIPYYLPVPLWLYAYAASGTLVVSFMILMFASGTRIADTRAPLHRSRREWRLPSAALVAAQAVGAMFVVMLIVAGLAGTQNPFQNLAMSGFWLWFYLGSVYVSAVVGDVYAFTNPFALLLRIAARCCPTIERGRYRYPHRAASYPALLAYVALIALELFGAARPRDAGLFLAGYAVYALAGALCFGRQVWLDHFDAFGVLCRLCARLSPLAWQRLPARDVAIVLRNPVADIASAQPFDTSVVMFLSFMLSSTAYDGLRDTATWSTLFWRGIYPLIVGLFPALKNDYAISGELVRAAQWATFVAVGFAYYGLYRAFCALGALGTRSAVDGRTFARQFCLLLLPIALFYNVCHYFTLFMDQGRQIFALLSDPLGIGWNLLSLPPADYSPTSLLINVAYIWHAQVLLILVGHILSVYFTHAIAVRNRVLAGTVVGNQLPLLALTIVLTISGLWILSLPLA
ncbi:hypothetical protein [Burkholderia multivorans]|uniref:hypothetical protein n=1 Tax=Burkholderia multivorans TaxID=87883 RepID=UPI000CFE9699|nr:hypothetical protein [Burkholderia multivorans]MBU9398425.1 hypothetical protein [Burkholderia multivorans]MDN8049882.1 hypothetical protein [Burkholderia multivorans]MDR9238288.1 hypothetical protein [Burkholderia multivorans]MDR9269035.1 hypothetical protein [Burkholderia multivorans]MDR9285873.1 hypothetical protein [Burkholderia multivorans]